MYLIRINIILLMIVLSSSLKGQEMNCQVQVIAPTLQSSPANSEIMQELQATVFEFINGTKWTNEVFQDEERIECSILININSKTGSDQFRASIQVSSSRPVYGSSFKSRLLNYNDNSLTFQYQRGGSLVFTPDRHQNNLADVLAFYVYMVIGYDYDSFSLKGGTPYFDKAQQIVSNCQNAPESGWKPQEGTKNRYWLVVNHVQNLFDPLRVCFYEYHRQGFDLLYSKRDEAIEKVTNAIQLLETIHKTRPNSFNVQMFFTAKADEITALYKGAPPDVKNTVFNTLVKLDPGNISRYNKMKQGK